MKPGATPINISAPSSDIVQLHPTLEVEDLPSIAIHSDEPTNIVIGPRPGTGRGEVRIAEIENTNVVGMHGRSSSSSVATTTDLRMNNEFHESSSSMTKKMSGVMVICTLLVLLS